jgi:hypothetical protein
VRGESVHPQRDASGKALLRQRGEHLERSFAHLLDHGGLRRATRRGCAKLTKRHLTAAVTYNLSLLMRTLFGVGTPKQAMADAHHRLLAALRTISRLFSALTFTLSPLPALRRLFRHPPSLCPQLPAAGCELGRFSTGC